MPTTYEELLTEVCPQVIENDEQYDTIGRRFGELLGKQRSRTAEETRLMRLLGLLIQDYDRRKALPGEKPAPASFSNSSWNNPGSRQPNCSCRFSSSAAMSAKH
jgi:hypothetical protein